MEHKINKILQKHAVQQTNLSSDAGRQLLVNEIMETIGNENGKDTCISCGNETPYNKETHIDNRHYYIEGAGQLCKNCFDNIY